MRGNGRGEIFTRLGPSTTGSKRFLNVDDVGGNENTKVHASKWDCRPELFKLPHFCRFGRWTIIMAVYVGTSIFSIAASFSNNIITFTILRFLTGFCAQAVYTLAFVIGESNFTMIF